MLNRYVIFLPLITAASVMAADWNPAAAARYLDDRQQEWFAWKPAQTPEGTCVSCHTGMPYLLARPALRKILKESQPTEWETKLMDRIRAAAGHERKANIQGPEAIFDAIFLAREDPNSRAAQAAHLQVRDLQLKEGSLMGILQWYDARLDPWESEGAFSWGAALGGLSGMVDAPHTVAWLREHRPKASLHSRLAMLWASPKLPGLFDAKERAELISEILSQQRPDGSMDHAIPRRVHEPSRRAATTRRRSSLCDRVHHFHPGAIRWPRGESRDCESPVVAQSESEQDYGSLVRCLHE